MNEHFMYAIFPQQSWPSMTAPSPSFSFDPIRGSTGATPTGPVLPQSPDNSRFWLQLTKKNYNAKYLLAVSLNIAINIGLTSFRTSKL